MEREPVKINIVGLPSIGKELDRTQPMWVSPILSDVLAGPEEDWQRRIRHRRAAVTHIKCTPEYVAANAHSSRPRTPDPEDRNVSKRSWEKSVKAWRRDLQHLVAACADAYV